MNFSSMSDRDLHTNTLKCAKNERVSLQLLLEHMAEVQRRKSFSPQYKSIHHWTVKELGYSDRSARRRVSAMFLFLQMPQIKESIQNGGLDLSKIDSVQNFVRVENLSVKDEREPSLFDEPPKQKMTTEEKIKIVDSITGKSSSESDRILASLSSNPKKLKAPDQIKAIDKNLNKVQTTLSDKDLETIKELRELLTHQIPDGSLSDILSAALTKARDAIKKERPAISPVRARKMKRIGALQPQQ